MSLLSYHNNRNHTDSTSETLPFITRLTPAVVKITVRIMEGSSFMRIFCGAVIDPSGLILTLRRKLEKLSTATATAIAIDVKYVVITDHLGKDYRVSSMFFDDKSDLDLAILKLETEKKWDYVSITGDQALATGHEVYLLTIQSKLPVNYLPGFVNSVKRYFKTIEFNEKTKDVYPKYESNPLLTQVTCSVWKDDDDEGSIWKSDDLRDGILGAPLFNCYGRLVGVYLFRHLAYDLFMHTDEILDFHKKFKEFVAVGHRGG